ncbi:O-antigen ligase family protein [Anabaena sp. FACHB-1237]|uniref:O-antigen ligase family protein n=1 Tax=Anabaena sp. FACHB-1237 TaxID=2692769 RepID=UPI001680041C|nr:O-antigen ligase family protein [Anabaena sp. FACHB-1237]MBD2138459.1 O-antigen ligase family protein [Anabaena sp. FACHB-1237]
MMTTLTKQKSLRLYYQSALAVGAISIFFTDLHLYLNSARYISFSPALFIAVFGIASIPLFLSTIKLLPMYLINWCILYISVSLISFISSDHSEIVLIELQTRLFSVVFLIIMSIIFRGNILISFFARWTVLIVTIINVINNFIELLNPSIFAELNDTYRPSGFYVDPNKSGCALMLGMIFSITLLPQKYRIPFSLLTGVGIILTFSRGAIISWLSVIMILIIQRKIAIKQLLIFGIITGAIILLMGSIGSVFLNTGVLEDIISSNNNINGRLAWLQDPSSSDSNSDISRLLVVEFALQKFAENPFLGNGIAYTQEWGEIRTHNMYLLLIVEHGFLAVLLMPLLILAVTHSPKIKTKDIAFTFAFFIMLWGIFSHRVFEERYILIMFSLMSAINMNSQLKPPPFHPKI